ncbi:MAG: hypothetical protein PVJ63_03225 [Thioalkalispiraceae bacterium]|jgi:hypothetical protein
MDAQAIIKPEQGAVNAALDEFSVTGKKLIRHPVQICTSMGTLISKRQNGVSIPDDKAFMILSLVFQAKPDAAR